MAESKDRFRLVSGHPEDLGNGRVATVDQEVGLTAEEQEEPTIVRLVEEGKLIAIPKKAAKEAPSQANQQSAKADGKGTSK